MKTLVLLLLLMLPVSAETSPKDVVAAFYKDFVASQTREAPEDAADERGWITYLLDKQKDHVEEPLREALLKLEAASVPSAVLEVDPFTNGTWALAHYTVKEPVMKDGLAYVPVAMYVGRGDGPEVERVRVVLRKTGDVWRVANVAYPARDGQPAWDLMSRLKAKLGS